MKYANQIVAIVGLALALLIAYSAEQQGMIEPTFSQVTE